MISGYGSSVSERESATGERAPSPLAAALARVGDRWTLLVVQALLPGPRRFNELLEEIQGIAPNILSERLKRLERDALLVSRPLHRATTPRGVRADRGGHGTRWRASAAGALGFPASRRHGSTPPYGMRYSPRGEVVLPDV
jgi:hypothetical protein